MALLQQDRTRRRFCPGPHALIGRAPECDLVLDSKLASTSHALLRWRHGQWWLRDIGSRNGTWLDDRKLEVGEDAALSEASRVCFGDRAAPWTLTHAGPPGPVAWAEGGGLVTARSGLLALPHPDDPQVVVLPDEEGWRIDADEGDRAAVSGARVELDGEAWTLLLPTRRARETLASTLELRELDDSGGPLLRFSVSQDEEHVELEAVLASGPLTLDARSHHFLLLELARARLEDAEADAPDVEQGWRYQDDLCRRLRLPPAQLRLHVFRARQQVAEAGLPIAACLVERRRLSRQLRLGVGRLEVWQGGRRAGG